MNKYEEQFFKFLWLVSFLLVTLLVFRKANAGDQVNWYKLKFGLNLDSSYEELATSLTRSFPMGRLSGDLMRHFGAEMKEERSHDPEAFFKRQIESLEANPLNDQKCRKLISCAHWLSHVYEYKNEWKNALTALEHSFHPACYETLHSARNFYEFGTFGHFQAPPVGHIHDHIVYVTNREF